MSSGLTDDDLAAHVLTHFPIQSPPGLSAVGFSFQAPNVTPDLPYGASLCPPYSDWLELRAQEGNVTASGMCSMHTNVAPEFRLTSYCAGVRPCHGAVKDPLAGKFIAATRTGDSDSNKASNGVDCSVNHEPAMARPWAFMGIGDGLGSYGPARSRRPGTR